MTRPTKHPRTGMYQVRVWVPEALRPHMGRREFTRSLGTKDPAEAKRLAPALVAVFTARIEEARRRLAAGEPIQPPGRVPSEADIRAAIRSWFHTVDRRAIASPLPDDLDAVLTEMQADEAALSDPSQGAEQASGALARTLKTFHFEAPPDALASLGVQLMREALLEGLALRRARLKGGSEITVRSASLQGATGLDVAPPRPAPAREVLKAETLLEAWAAEVRPARATQAKYAGAFKRVGAAIKQQDVRRWTPEDVVKFKQARLKAGRDPKTVSDDVLACGAVCRWAVTNRLLDVNPFAGMAPKVNRRGEAARAPYDDEDAKRILTAARNEAGWLRWGPWLLAFTGARIGEIAELRRRDVRKEGGVWILDVRPTAQREGKNETFQRMLPIHPGVIEEGFLGYVSALPPDPNGPLFPSITASVKAGSRATNAQAEHGRWMRGTVKITDARKAPAHSWRHRMEDELRKVRALPEVQDAVTGRHNPRNAGAGYGKGFRGMPAEVLKDLERIPSPVPTLGQAGEDDEGVRQPATGAGHSG